MPRTVVIGGTGTVGRHTVLELLKRGVDVRVMTRSETRIASLPTGVEGVVGSMLEPASLPAVFADADALFLVTPLARDETAQGIDAVDAAVASGVRRIVYVSVHQADAALAVPHFVSKLPVEGVIRDSGVEFTILRPNSFFQNDLPSLRAIRSGVYPSPLGGVGLHRVDVRDIAEAAAAALTEAGHSGRTYSLVGRRSWTGPDIAALLAQRLGTPVTYGGDDVQAWAARVRAVMPGWLVRDLSIMYAYFQTRGFLATEQEIAECTTVLGHAPRSYEDFVDEILLA